MSVSIRLPGFYIDSVVTDDAAPAIEVINRFPAVDEVNVPADAHIQFDIARTDGVGLPDLSTVEITINGVPAYTSSTFQAGFAGAESAVVPVGANTYSFTIDLGANLLSNDVVTVDVTAHLGLSSSWSFTVEDLTSAVLLSAQARDKKVVRLTFNEPLVSAGDSTTKDALTASNYTFIRGTIPSVNVAAASVTQVSDTIYDVTTDIELTFGGAYIVVVSNVEDLNGNSILAPYNQAAFSGFVPNTDGRRVFDLYNFLAQINRDEDATQDLRLFIAMLQEVTDIMVSSIDDWTNIIDPDKASTQFVDAMLCDLGNPFPFVAELSLQDKRRLIRILLDTYKLKGTAVGIVSVIRFFLGVEVEIVTLTGEGWELGVDELGVETSLGPGTSFLLYSFEIVSPVVLTDEQRQRITDIADLMKPAHTHLLRIVEPTVPDVIDHWELGLSALGETSLLHE